MPVPVFRHLRERPTPTHATVGYACARGVMSTVATTLPLCVAAPLARRRARKVEREEETTASGGSLLAPPHRDGA